MYEKVCEILLNYVEEPEGGLTPETKFIDDLAMNSLDVMTMIGDIEDEFDVTIETADGVQITGSITNESIEDLGLAEGATAVAIIKATDVLVGIE